MGGFNLPPGVTQKDIDDTCPEDEPEEEIEPDYPEDDGKEDDYDWEC